MFGKNRHMGSFHKSCHHVMSSKLGSRCGSNTAAAASVGQEGPASSLAETNAARIGWGLGLASWLNEMCPQDAGIPCEAPLARSAHACLGHQQSVRVAAARPSRPCQEALHALHPSPLQPGFQACQQHMPFCTWPREPHGWLPAMSAYRETMSI